LGCSGRRPLLLLLGQPPGVVADQAGHQQEDDVGHARDQAQQADDAGGEAQGRGELNIWLRIWVPDVHVAAHARDHHGGGHRDQQAGDLGHQRVTDGQQDVGAGRLAHRQAVLGHADDEAADDVDHQDQDAGHGVAAHELAGTVHGAEEVGFLAHFGAALLGLVLVDQAGVQVGVDGHLLAGHRVQGEARAHLGDALGALGDHHEVDDHQDGEHDQTDREVAADQEVAEGLDHLAGRAGPVWPSAAPPGWRPRSATGAAAW
jgi:hypothetical protein